MANLLASPRFYKKKALLIKLETVVGTDAVPTGAANWVEGRNVRITPMQAETAERNIDLPYLGRGGKLQVAQYAQVQFEVALTGPSTGAAGDAPRYAPLLLSCGFAETLTVATDAVYNLVSTAFKAVSAIINMDGTDHKMIGSRGSVSYQLNAKGIPVMRFQFDAIFVDPSEVSPPAVTTTGWPVEEPVTADNTSPISIAGVDLVFSAFSLDLANQLSRINLPGPQKEVAIGDRAPAGSVTVLCPALSVFNPFALAKAGTNVPLQVTHGSGAGKQSQLDANVVITGVDYAEVDKMAAYTLTYEPTPVSGNDEFAHTVL